MRKILVIQIVIAAIALLMAACGHSDTFVVNGTIEGAPTMNIRVIYTMRGQVFTGVTAATDGKFSFKAAAPDTAIVELYDNDYALLGRFLTVNGEDINLSLTRSPYRLTVEGNDISQRWAKFLSDNAEALQAADGRHNAVIAKYIEANPTDEVSTLLLITEYNVALSDSAAMQAQQLWQTLRWKPAGLTASFAMQLTAVADTAGHCTLDSLRYLRSGNTHATFVAADHPLTLIAISSERQGRDSTLATLRRIKDNRNRLPDGRPVYILDLSIDTDTLDWSRSLRRDSATWQRGWLHSGPANPTLRRLHIPTAPYYILLDSAGTQLLRTTTL